EGGLTPVKVNAVRMRGVNDTSAVAVLQGCLDRGHELRFVGQMPLDAQHAGQSQAMIAAGGVHERPSARLTRAPLPGERAGRAPAERFLGDGGPPTVGSIASVTRPFCGACDRTRLTADGQVRNCLFSRRETDLRGPMRAGASDEEIAALINGEM